MVLVKIGVPVQVRLSGPYRLNVIVPVGATPPARVAVSEIEPPTVTVPEATVTTVGLFLSRLFENVHVTFSPSLRLMLTPNEPLLLCEPPLGLVTEQSLLVRDQPDGSVSATEYVVKFVMPANTLVFAEVPSSTRLKAANGAGDAANAKDVEPSGVASLMIVIDPGKMTASADSERSWLPPAPSRSISRVWYGEPGIATAELSMPQSCRAAMWPPQARTGLATAAENVKVMRADLSPVNPEPVEYE